MSAPITATFLFTDLVGSTALASRLGPEAAEALRQAHFAILRGAAEGTGGIEVKTTGDGIMLMFTGPSRALSCAAAIQQGVDRHNRRGEEPIELRVGVSMGEAVEEAGDYFGDCVVEAARLCDKATGGQVLTTELLKAMVGRHSTHEFASVGELELKGLPEPVAAVEVRWEPEAAAGDIPVPSRLVGTATEGLFGFFGRNDELAAALDAAKRAQTEGHPEVVLLEGEPGIGKTTLAAQVARTLHADGATVLFGHCSEGMGVPYRPWIEALTHLVEHAPQELLDTHVERHGAALSRLVPELVRRVPTAEPNGGSGDADGDRYVLLEAMCALLRDAARDQIVVLVLDDLQWADAASLQVLRHVISTANPPPLLVVGTYRDTDLTREHALTAVLADLRREPVVSRLAIRGLDDAELLELVEGAAGYELPEDGVLLARALYRETGGNPFFTGELLRHLYETGAIVFDDHGQYSLSIDLDDITLPGSVRDVVMRRVDRLGDDVAKLLSMAAVIGRTFDLAVLSAIAERSEDDVLDVLEQAVAAALITEVGELPGRFRFEHALIEHTLYQDLSATRRQRLHQRVAQALETMVGEHAPPIAELAHHWLVATQPADAAKAIEYARLAGDAALEALAPLDAVRWFSQALELQERQLADDTMVRCDLLIGLGTAQQLAGLADERQTLIDAARLATEADDGARLVRAAFGLARRTQAYDPDDARIAVLRAALDRVPPESADAARLLAFLACELDQRDHVVVEDAAREAIDMARRLTDERTLLDVLIGTWGVGLDHDDLEDRIDVALQAVALADRLGDRLRGFDTRYNLHEVLVVAGEVDLARAVFFEFVTIAEGLGLPIPRHSALLPQSAYAAMVGDLAAAESLADAALELANAAGIPAGIGIYGGQLFDLRFIQGRMDELSDFFVEAVAAMPTIEPLRVGVVTLLLEIGDTAGAAERFEFERDLGFAYGGAGRLQNLKHLADAAVGLGHVDAAGTLLELTVPYREQMVFVHAIAPDPMARAVARLCALLGRDDDAQQLFATALELCERFGAVYWAGRTHVERAEMYARRGASGDRDLAEGDLAKALEYAARCQGVSIERRVDAVRADLDQTPGE
jgi:class 3 adenylate cyclase/tetratricopeptide (TPR) repeat protein